MAYVSVDKYSPYPRVCDVCGAFKSVNRMRKLDGQTYVCDSHPGERTAIMLDTLNAHMRIPQMWPNKDPKPQNPEYPNTLETDEGAAFSLIDRMLQAQLRYESIENGASGYSTGGGGAVAAGWAGRYLYGLIVQGTRTTLLARARVLLATAADYILTRQYGSPTGILPALTIATTPFFGAVLESGATTFVTNDIATCGLALLYAYRTFGTAKYIVGARAVASYLRNVQAIGSHGVQFTSSNSAGTARLYTGSLASEVSTAIGVDPGEQMFSNHSFYPSALVTLWFWKELTTTDGDQSIGATAAVNGFATTPAQLMSTSMTDLRDCWTNGITQTNGTLINGLSSETPREFFNAYPATKSQFSITGTGMWEFSDGGASTGTQITSQTFGLALGSLYSYEGASTQATTILTWLQDFESNETYETADNTSNQTLYHATTGDYDPLLTVTTALTVRDSADSYAAIAENGSSVYDWGAFGLMGALIASQNLSTFKAARLGALNLSRRYDDGTPNDAIYDRIALRGISGLSFQTGFRVSPLPINNDAVGAAQFALTYRLAH